MCGYVLSLLVMVLPATPAAKDAPPAARRLVEAANAALTTGDLEDASRLLSEAVALAPANATIRYNQGVATYRRGDFPAAAEHFRQALLLGDRQLAGSARFNLGNCHYADALGHLEDAGTALDALAAALAQYKDALADLPDDRALRANIERTQRLIDQLQNQPPPEENDQEQQPEQENGEGQDQEQPSGDSEEGEPSEEPPPQDDGGPSKSGDQGEEGESNDAQEGEPGAGDQSKPGDPSAEGQPASADEASGEDPTPGADSSAGDPESGDPQPTDATAGDEADPPQSQEAGPVPPADAQAGDGEGRPIEVQISREQAERLLQLIRDKTARRRQEQARRQRARLIPVERDW